MLRAFLAAALFLLAALGPFSGARAEVVARAAMAIGDVSRVASGGKAEPLAPGGSVASGDRIITGNTGIAVLVFSDGGRVSLRAESELVIHRYRVDPTGANTRLEFELVRGTMRQISGEAARMQPERYRLNTPIAAIGVRGTDFLARASGASTETFVNEGTIVVSPSAQSCAAPPCASATVSAADGGRFVTVLPSGRIERRAIGSEDLERIFGIRLAPGADGGGAGKLSARASGTVFIEGAGADALARLNGTGSQWSAEVDAALVAGLASRPNPNPALPSLDSMRSRDLVWGRFSGIADLDLQLLFDFAQASAGRHVTIGEIGYYALWRAGVNSAFEPALRGRVEFSLAGAEALLSPVGGGTASAATVRSASLGVDFDRSLFSAGVDLTHGLTGPVSVSVAGKVNDEGMFWGGNASQRVAGALSRDGREAGFLFTRDTPAGTLRGVTLWNAR